LDQDTLLKDFAYLDEDFTSSPSHRFNQELTFYFDKRAIEQDPNFEKLNEFRKEREH